MPSKKVLVVDDDRLIGWALKKGLSSESLALHVAENGREALAAVSADPFDLVLLDVHLPDTNGLVLMKTIQGISPGTKVIVISADVNRDTIREALSEGALQFIEKPFEIPVITDVVNTVLSRDAGRRTAGRLVCSISVRISVLDPGPDESSYDLSNLRGTALDIGRAGIRVSTEYPLRVGQQVHLESLEKEDPLHIFFPPRTAASVRWVSPCDAGYTAGLQFLSG